MLGCNVKAWRSMVVGFGDVFVVFLGVLVFIFMLKGNATNN